MTDVLQPQADSGSDDGAELTPFDLLYPLPYPSPAAAGEAIRAADESERLGLVKILCGALADRQLADPECTAEALAYRDELTSGKDPKRVKVEPGDRFKVLGSRDWSQMLGHAIRVRRHAAKLDSNRAATGDEMTPAAAAEWGTEPLPLHPDAMVAEVSAAVADRLAEALRRCEDGRWFHLIGGGPRWEPLIGTDERALLRGYLVDLAPLLPNDPQVIGTNANGEPKYGPSIRARVLNGDESAYLRYVASLVARSSSPVFCKAPDSVWRPASLRGPDGTLYDLLPTPHVADDQAQGEVWLNCTAYTPDLDAANGDDSTPHFDLLCEALWPDLHEREYALDVLSNVVTGYNDRVLPFLDGPGGLGKTALVLVLINVLGSYATTVRADVLKAGAGAGSSDSDTIGLQGKRLAYLDEGPNDSKASQEKLKQMSGGGKLTARAPYAKEAIEFRQTHTLVISANKLIKVTDPAVRTRLRALLATAGLGADVADDAPELAEARRHAQAVVHAMLRKPDGSLGALDAPDDGTPLTAEGPAILGKMMQRAAAVLQNPDRISHAAAPRGWSAYVADKATQQDPVALWLESGEVTDVRDQPQSQWTIRTTLSVRFADWCERQGIKGHAKPQAAELYASLATLGYPTKDRKGQGPVKSGRVIGLRYVFDAQQAASDFA
jgi:hypothetical protein